MPYCRPDRKIRAVFSLHQPVKVFGVTSNSVTDATLEPWSLPPLFATRADIAPTIAPDRARPWTPRLRPAPDGPQDVEVTCPYEQ